MNPTPDREEELFAQALALPPTERLHFLERECAGDAALLRRVHALLQSEQAAADFLEKAAPGTSREDKPTSPAPEEMPGSRIGRYKLLQKIGEGGCGVVYMAEQEEPIRRKVALKVIKLGMDTKEVIARFESERQALALMDHPNIARVLDAGATETGRPYFVMELVRGTKITTYSDENRLSTTARLELFMQVCAAIEHAHQKGIVHRDLKPSNILVTLQDGAPTPKVIDFGIAKATQGRLTDRTLFTAFEQFIGTPAYMSPEQAELSSQDVDSRSDIYSLGVLLYELLTGQPPFDPAGLVRAGVDEMRRVIRDVEPPLPSACLRTLAADTLTAAAHCRQTEPPRLIYGVRGDLDWIAMRCLEKNRMRRYSTASQLADDLKRHLEHRPVTARRPGLLYRLGKFARRRRQPLTIASAALLAGVIVGLLVLHPLRQPVLDTGKVGGLGVPDAITFSGNRTFSARAIREALRNDVTFTAAAHPEASIADFAAVTSREILQGYRHLGFPDATVKTVANVAQQRLEVSVAEGPRFLCGELQVTGLDRAGTADLARALSGSVREADDPLIVAMRSVLAGQQASLLTAASTSATANPPSELFAARTAGEEWPTGAPTPFDDGSLKRITETVRRWLDARGFPLAEVKPHLERDTQAGRAHLQIEVTEGPAVVVGSLITRGHHRNTADEVLRCAGLATGMRLNSELLDRARLALWNSARFYSFAVAARPPPVGSSSCDLEIVVEESEKMPPLREALPRHQIALARFANWLTAESGRRELDFTISPPGLPDVVIALTPEKYLAAGTEDPAAGSLLLFLARQGNVRLFGADRLGVAGLDLIRWRGRANAFFHLTTSPAALSPGRPADVSVGYGIVEGDTDKSGEPPPFILSPVFACEFLAGETAPRFEAGDVVLERSLGEVNMRIRFREETGELVECAALSPFGPTTPGSPAPAPRLSLKLDGHEFARLAQRADQDWAQLPYDPARRRPLADVVLASPLAKACVAKPELSRPFHLTTATLRFCERLFTTPELRARLEREGPSKGAAFTIPAGNAPSDSVGAAVSQTLLVCSRLLGPAQSWPSRLARELSDSFAGDSTRSAAMLDAIDADPTIGPLGSLLTAKLLQLAGSPGAWRFARRASERNQVEDFRNDLQTLFEGEAPPARLVRTLLAGLAALSDEEVAALGADLALEDRQLLEQAIGLLRATKAEGVTAALQPLMERWWSRQMQPQLAAKIHRIMTPEGDVDPVTIAAAINGQPVRRSLLELCRRQPELLLPLPRLPGPSHPTAPGQEHPDSALERLAILTLLLPEAAAAGVDLSDTAIDRDIKDAVHAQHAVDRSAFETSLSRDGTSLEDYRTLLRLNRAYEGMRQTYSQPPGQPGAWEAHLTGLRDTAFLYVLPIAPTSAQRTRAH